jgi:hypothetical protein
MIVPFAIAAWIFSLALVTGLCRAARRGDLQPHSAPLADPAGESIELFVVARGVAVHRSGQLAPPGVASQPVVHAEDGSVRGEDSSPRRSPTPGDLALQPG